ncbi:MAG TPA: UDP-N-acetylmuramyl-tripeptide synthetase, partial [Acidimicrobiales bacterium]|nr:UDP-N-acetylmuramyl-tripeptide synthetase [Acidimicrobiales bacterium]
MRLGSVLAAAGLEQPGVSDQGGPEVADVVISSKEVTPGALFACIPGQHADGHDFAEEALAKGAVALLCERRLPFPVPQVVVGSVRRTLGPVSSALWGWPSRRMKVVGVTGTNGKTTTCVLLAGIFEANGWQAAVIGTLTGERTTPEAPVLQRRLDELRRQGTAAVAMEVSSHALDQHRVGGTCFEAAVFTNLSQDHLDYHGTMEEYFAAKARLFLSGQVPLAIINSDDDWGARLAAQVSQAGSATVVTFSPREAADVRMGPRGLSFSWRGELVELQMGGSFNVANALAAATAAMALGIGTDAIRRGLRSAPAVRGRFEAVEVGQPF